MPLLAADEIMRLPYDEALLSIGGLHPYRGKKIMDFLDERFVDCMRPAPESVEAQRAELPPAPAHGWDTEPIEPSVDVLAELKKRFGIEDPEEDEDGKAAGKKKSPKVKKASAKCGSKSKQQVIRAYDAVAEMGERDDAPF
jgi:type IV secretory pathway TraG/TraD family ATPase VirD4